MNLVARQKQAELMSAIGAGVLGFGLGAWLANFVAGFALYIVLVGLVMHSWGMYDKHRLEAAEQQPRPWWADALYWACWLSLIFLLVYAAMQ